MDFLSIILEDLGGPKKQFFISKPYTQKVQAIMAHCGQNLHTSEAKIPKKLFILKYFCSYNSN